MRTQRPGKAQTRVGPVCRSKRSGYGSPPALPSAAPRDCLTATRGAAERSADVRTQRPGIAQTRVGPVCRSKRSGYGSPPRFPRLRLGIV